MRKVFVIGAASLLLLACAGIAFGQVQARFSARLSPPPEVQTAGQSYMIGIVVNTNSNSFSHFCIDFEDDHNSWVVKMPGLRAYDDDVFCFGRLRAHVKKGFYARLIAAKTGAHTLRIGLGQATIYPTTNDAILDESSRWWSGQFVITA